MASYLIFDTLQKALDRAEKHAADYYPDYYVGHPDGIRRIGEIHQTDDDKYAYRVTGEPWGDVNLTLLERTRLVDSFAPKQPPALVEEGS